MKIEYTPKFSGILTFSQLKPGDLFMDSDGDISLKTTEGVVDTMAIVLVKGPKGEMLQFDLWQPASNRRVTPVIGTLKIG